MIVSAIAWSLPYSPHWGYSGTTVFIMFSLGMFLGAFFGSRTPEDVAFVAFTGVWFGIFIGPRVPRNGFTSSTIGIGVILLVSAVLVSAVGLVISRLGKALVDAVVA